MAGCKWSVVIMFVFVIIAAVAGSLLRLPPSPPIIPDDDDGGGLPGLQGLDAPGNIEHFYNVSDSGSDTEGGPEGVDGVIEPCDPLWLMRVFDGEAAAGYFKVDRILNALPDCRHVISLSLYCKHDDNKFAEERPDPSREHGGDWHRDVLEPLLALIESAVSRPELRDFKVRVHLARDLAVRDILEKLQGKRVEIYVMAHVSVGAQPGRMWRFLPWDDAGLDLACCLGNDGDAEEQLDLVGRLLKVFKSHKNHAVAKMYGGGGGGRGTVVVRPALVSRRLAMVQLMQAYISYAMTKSVLKHAPVWFGGGGPGDHWHTAGFDARFLAHVVFPLLFKEGLVVLVGDARTVEASPDEELHALRKNPNNIVARAPR